MTIVTGYAPINGARVYYEAAGSGDTLVFIHAGVADRRLWDDPFQTFAEKYRVIRYDLRGYGKSEPVDGEYSHTDDLLGLLHYLNVEKAILIGCSMGGGAAMNVALSEPSRVSALVMVCSGPQGLDLDVPALKEFEEAETAWKAKDWDQLAEIETHIWFDGVSRSPNQPDAAIRAKAYDMCRVGLSHYAKELGKEKAGMKPSAAERLSELALPVLLIVGTLDTPYIIAANEHMDKHIRNVRKVMIENTAHLPSLERPQEFNAALSVFLASLQPVQGS
ncbi:MAG: alpha/beta hydrolase [Anaerolineae bacterium]